MKLTTLAIAVLCATVARGSVYDDAPDHRPQLTLTAADRDLDTADPTTWPDWMWAYTDLAIEHGEATADIVFGENAHRISSLGADGLVVFMAVVRWSDTVWADYYLPGSGCTRMECIQPLFMPDGFYDLDDLFTMNDCFNDFREYGEHEQCFPINNQCEDVCAALFTIEEQWDAFEDLYCNDPVALACKAATPSGVPNCHQIMDCIGDSEAWTDYFYPYMQEKADAILACFEECCDCGVQ